MSRRLKQGFYRSRNARRAATGQSPMAPHERRCSVQFSSTPARAPQPMKLRARNDSKGRGAGHARALAERALPGRSVRPPAGGMGRPHAVSRTNGGSFILAGQPEQQQAGCNAAQAEEAKLPVAQLHQLAEAAPPGARRDEGQQPFDHQHQRQRAPEHFIAHGRRVFQLRGAALAVVLPELRSDLKKSEDEGSTTSTSLFLLKLCL